MAQRRTLQGAVSSYSDMLGTARRLPRECHEALQRHRIQGVPHGERHRRPQEGGEGGETGERKGGEGGEGEGI